MKENVEISSEKESYRTTGKCFVLISLIIDLKKIVFLLIKIKKLAKICWVIFYRQSLIKAIVKLKEYSFSSELCLPFKYLFFWQHDLPYIHIFLFWTNKQQYCHCFLICFIMGPVLCSVFLPLFKNFYFDWCWPKLWLCCTFISKYSSTCFC